MLPICGSIQRETPVTWLTTTADADYDGNTPVASAAAMGKQALARMARNRARSRF